MQTPLSLFFLATNKSYLVAVLILVRTSQRTEETKLSGLPPSVIVETERLGFCVVGVLSHRTTQNSLLFYHHGFFLSFCPF